MPTILLCLITFIVWLSYKKSKTEKAQKHTTDAFWAREQEANTTRKKDLSSLHYITIPYEALPFRENADEETLYVQKELKKLSAAKIVNFSGRSNTDLKLEYGTANLTELSIYDQNYTVLARTLNKWGQLLLNNGQKQDAQTVLEYAVSIGSDISATYLNLAVIYKENSCTNELESLYEKACELTTPMKDSLLAKLSAITGENLLH